MTADQHTHSRTSTSISVPYPEELLMKVVPVNTHLPPTLMNRDRRYTLNFQGVLISYPTNHLLWQTVHLIAWPTWTIH